MKNAAAGTSRDPSTLRSVTDPSSSSSTAGISAAGSACTRLPTVVPRLRIVGCATWRSARRSSGTASYAACVVLHPAVPRQRPHVHRVGVDAHAVETRDVVDVDEVLGAGQPHRHQRHQALPAREHLAALAQPGEHVERLVQAARAGGR